MSEAYPLEKIRKDFPALHQRIHNYPLAYFDNAATTQRPQFVIDAITRFYQHDNANVHRGVHTLSDRASTQFEIVRKTVQTFINAVNDKEIIFNKGTTEGINLVAQSYLYDQLRPGDEILISTMEHHANIVPWQMISQKTGANLKIIPITGNGELDLETVSNYLNANVKFLALTHVSNVLGTINPLKKIINMAHELDIPVLIDGAQAPAHIKIDVQDLDCDFYVFSSHKMYGPMGVGVLYGKLNLLDKMSPYQGGGGMIEKVTFEKTTYTELPHKFEAGTPDVAGLIGLKAAIVYLEKIGLNSIAAYENELLQYLLEKLRTINDLVIIGNPKDRGPVISFYMKNIHAIDLATLLDTYGIAVRSGHHCAMPLLASLGLSSTVRVSLAMYNTKEEIDQLVDAIEKCRDFL